MLPILFVVSETRKMNISLSPFAPENLVSRDGFGRPIPRQSAHSPYNTQVESGPYSRHSSRFPRRCPLIYFKPPHDIGSVPSLPGHVITHRSCSLPRVRRHRISTSQGSSSNGCCLCITMDQLMCASRFPHPLLVDVGMLKSAS